jgi:hypothetical protein
LEERKVYYASRLAPGYLQNGASPELRGFYSKKQTWQLAFQGKNILCQCTYG